MANINNNVRDSAYHCEIDGLRAISVLVITLFHLKVPGMHGGFIGVDVFFVISGFLITQILAANMQAGQFTFRDFYLRRSLRILPALVLTIFLSLCLAIYVQQPGALLHTAWEGIYALASVSNFFYLSESNYWAPSSENYPLLHTWSLGVEEQFYLIYPLLLLIAYRLAGMRGLLLLLTTLFLVGTVASELIVKSYAASAFFVTPLRFFEFAIGGLGALLFPYAMALRRQAWLAAALTSSGLALIAYAVVRFSGWHPLPGVLMLVPTLGTVLVLLAGPSLVARGLLINAPMRWLGKISYSVYLVHWPIIVFYRYRQGAELSVIEQGSLFVIILLSAHCMNRWVEQRLRMPHGVNVTASGHSPVRVLYGTLVLACMSVSICATLLYSQGWPSRLPEAAQSLLQITPRADMRRLKQQLEKDCLPQGDVFCGKREEGKKNIWLLGDSRALDTYAALNTAYPEANVLASYAMGCPPVFTRTAADTKFFPNCLSFNKQRLKAVMDAPDTDIVFLSQQWIIWREEAIFEAVRRLRESGKTVYLLGQFKIVALRNPVDITIEALRYPFDTALISKHVVAEPFGADARYAERAAALGVNYIRYQPLFFDGALHFDDRASGQLLTYDGKHLNVQGAEHFGVYLSERYPLP